MAEATRLPRYSLEEYLLLEQMSNVRHEYLDGLMYAWGRIERDAADRNALTNPVVLVEVTSPTTEAYDRGEKLDHYKRLPSLREALIVSHGERRLEVLRRDGEGRWTAESFGPGSTARLLSVEAELPVDAVYRNPLPD